MSRHLPANRETAQKGRDHVVAELCRRGASSVGFIVVGQQPQLIASTAIGTVSLRVKTRYSGDWFELFVERVNGLMNTKLGRDGFGVNMEMHFESGKGLFYMFEQPEEDALQSFLLTFRQFVSQGEPVHLPAIYKLCLRHIANETVKSNLVKSRESWKKAVAGASIGLTIDSRAFTPE